jgi:hypothetical protein
MQSGQEVEGEAVNIEKRGLEFNLLEANLRLSQLLMGKCCIESLSVCLRDETELCIYTGVR